MKIGRIGVWLERMSDRERKIVLGGTAVAVAAGLLLVGVLVSRRVSALEEQVADNETALREVVGLAPKYLHDRQDEKAVQEQLERATKESLQATVLNIAKLIEYEKKDEEGNVQKSRLSDNVKFANATEILAELTQKKKGATQPKKKHKKGAKEVFLASIDVVFQNVPDEALMQFMAKVESHPDPLFGISVDMSRNSPTREAFQATMKIGQFRYGTLEE
jgi:type II secretory pathway component PulM